LKWVGEPKPIFFLPDSYHSKQLRRIKSGNGHIVLGKVVESDDGEAAPVAVQGENI
jgi:hypothetical protein